MYKPTKEDLKQFKEDQREEEELYGTLDSGDKGRPDIQPDVTDKDDADTADRHPDVQMDLDDNDDQDTADRQDRLSDDQDQRRGTLDGQSDHDSDGDKQTDVSRHSSDESLALQPRKTPTMSRRRKKSGGVSMKL